MTAAPPAGGQSIGQATPTPAEESRPAQAAPAAISDQPIEEEEEPSAMPAISAPSNRKSKPTYVVVLIPCSKTCAFFNVSAR